MKKLVILILIVLNSVPLLSQINYKNQSFKIGIESINNFKDFL